MESHFWQLFTVATAVKVMLVPAYHSTDFEVHRNWLAITHSLPLKRWYYDATSEWTLDYPPFFAYFEWLLSQLAYYIDPQMLQLHNFNYASEQTKYFQCSSVIVCDVLFALGVKRCLRALQVSRKSQLHFAAELLLLLNIGLIFVDHIHFQYNGLLFGILLLSISFLLEDRIVLSAFTFAVLLNFKHIFLYMAPAFAVYYLKFYCLIHKQSQIIVSMGKLLVAGLFPFLLSFGPFLQQLPQVLSRLFPFKRGLTHAYWAPNFWALYNSADKVLSAALRIPRMDGLASSTSGLVQEIKHAALPSITPLMTFILTLVFMMPILVKLFQFTNKSESKTVFLRAVVLCACASFMFGWHVHEKAILMCLIPLCFLSLLDASDAKYAFMLSAAGYFSLFPLLFHVDLLLIRYSLYLGYIAAMYGQLMRIHKAAFHVHLNNFDFLYLGGFILLPLYEHTASPLLGLNEKLPFMPLLLTSLYCSLGVIYFFIGYYWHALKGATIMAKTKKPVKAKLKPKTKVKIKQKLK